MQFLDFVSPPMSPPHGPAWGIKLLPERGPCDTDHHMFDEEQIHCWWDPLILNAMAPLWRESMVAGVDIYLLLRDCVCLLQ